VIDIKLEKFEGPLYLLVHLVEQEKMDVTQISLARIADQYIEYIQTSVDRIGAEEIADFLVIAGRLLLIKSKALLPYIFPEDEEEIVEFEGQLKIYKEYLEATKIIEAMLGEKKFMFVREWSRRAPILRDVVFAAPKGVTAPLMRDIFASVIDRLQPAEKLEEASIDHHISIEDRILLIKKMVLDRVRVSFSKVMEGAKNKTEVIVSFLAMLEMTRQREVVIEQGEMFGEIFIEKS